MGLRSLLLSLFLFFAGICQAAPASITTDEAKNHIGENATVCGIVAGVHYAANSRGNPTFVNLDKPYPNQVFTILIWGEDLPKFDPKPSSWDGKKVCVTGPITSYQGRPEIIAKAQTQIAVEEAKSK
jgi:hypothetical protein